MAVLGRAVTILGVLLVLAPLAGAAGSIVDVTVPWVLEYAPTFILAGITVFVVGVGLQNFGR